MRKRTSSSGYRSQNLYHHSSSPPSSRYSPVGAFHPTRGRSDLVVNPTHARVVPEDNVSGSGHFKEKYKSSKAVVKTLEKKNLEMAAELKLAQLQIAQLQKQQTSYLDALVDRQSYSDSEDDLPLPTRDLSNQRKGVTTRTFKPYEFLPKRSAPTKPPPQPTSSGVNPGPPKPYTRRDPDAVRRVQAIPTDESGSFLLPAQVGIFTIFSLGIIEYQRPNFHTKRYILPIGLKISRYYRSTLSPDSQALYTSTILDDGNGPRFEVVADDRPNEPFISDTSSGAWTQILKLASQVRNLQVSNSGSGPEYIGLAHPSIAYMIQSLPNADKCQRYLWQKFDVIAPRPLKRRLQVTTGSTARTSPAPSVPSHSLPAERESSPVSSPHPQEEPSLGVTSEPQDLTLTPTPDLDSTSFPPKLIDSDPSPPPPKKFRIWE